MQSKWKTWPHLSNPRISSVFLELDGTFTASGSSGRGILKKAGLCWPEK